MNRKQFGILVILLIALGGGAWLVKRTHDRKAGEGEKGTGQKLFGSAFPINDVSAISIAQNSNIVHLEKKGDVWKVRERGDYPANFPQISATLITLQDLKVVQNEKVGPSQLKRLQLAPAGQGTNSAINLILQNTNGLTLKNLLLGKKHLSKESPRSQFQFGESSAADGRYVMMAENPQNALLIGNALADVEPKPEAWLDKDFFKVERPKSIAVIYPAGTNSWKLFKDLETGDWKLADAKADEKLDDARVSGVSSPFASPSFSDVAPLNQAPANSGLDKPTIITIETFDDFVYTIKVGTKSGEEFPMTIDIASKSSKERILAKDEKLEDKAKADAAWKVRDSDLATKLKATQKFTGWIYLVPTWTVDSLLKERKDLLAEKKDTVKPDATGK